MTPSSSRSWRRVVAAAEVVVLGGFALFVALPDPARAAGAAVAVLGSLAVVLVVILGLTRSRVAPALAVVAAACAVGVPGAVLYLRSLADDPSAIPLGGVGVLVLSLLGLAVTALVLWSGEATAPAVR